MASELANQNDGAGRLRRIDLTLRTEKSFPVPVSDGYTVYSALLAVLEGVDASVSERVHDSALGSLHSSGLVGTFGGSDRPHHKTVRSGETYDLSLGVVDPADEAIFRALVSGLVLDGDAIELSHGTMRVESFESANTSHEELIDEAGAYDDPTIEVTFRTPTCIGGSGDVTTMFPHRWAVFNSLLGKWNKSCPEELQLDVERTAIEAHVIEKPDPDQRSGYCLDTHSVLVSRGEDEDGENRNIFSQGFTGTCAYEFKGADESLMNALTAVALFGEYSGVGGSVARGCGSVEVTISND
ncbi:CRISPR-associated protein Cas6 [Halalkaliarchaeum desulfuricum]|uniref:CRISPR-associated protein Cas6 n=1 Tax=Halalkaliarchaeum desulfuricum TaxID=2055893 RepID=A0A343TGH6_9EURY|nr:CRISPR system precrRNA processing endoribonuclease RAMP protein Cas6 [Halalkaliarchaeum desulfuricum]AUX08198.1 CRISPR-associated protein Cas6 [Halalkaliarchaeum desulfuricum]